MRTNSSGIKRGLATVAISALAVTGIPALASPASATPLAEQSAAGTVTLVAPATDDASVEGGTSVHLVATGGSDVQEVRFEYVRGGTTTVIDTVSRANGVFEADWSPPASINNLANTTVRAVGLDNLGNEVHNDSDVIRVSTTADSVDLLEPSGAIGVFQQPYAAPNNQWLGSVSGTVTGADADPSITASSSVPGTASLGEDVIEPVTAGDDSRTWSGPVDFTNYPFDTTDPEVDESVVYASLGNQDDDAEAVTVVKQTIEAVEVTAEPASVGAGEQSTGVVKVTGQGKPVVGAEVFQDNDGDNAPDGPAVYTNSEGEAHFPNLDGATGAGTTHSFYVNTSDVDNYENGVDFKDSVTITEYVPEPTALSATSADGAAFDFDENAAGDVTVTLEDQNDNPVAGESVFYTWSVTPFETTAGYPKEIKSGSVVTDADGVASVPFETDVPGTYTLKYFVNTDGTPGQGANDVVGTDLVVKAGEADIVWADGAKAQAQAGTTATFEGTLELEDGTALDDRDVALTWTRTATGDAALAAQSAQPAGTDRASNTAATATTDADGSFGVAVTDPAAADVQPELDGKLLAENAATDDAELTVDFLKDAGAATVELDGVDGIDALIDDKATPGRPVDFDIVVKNSDGQVLSDYPVSVEVDRGFLSPDAETDADLTADPAPAADGLYGEWKSEGTEKELSTDDTGETGFVVAIEDDADFATEQKVTTTVTVKAGNVVETFPVEFTSADPLNGGEVRVELAEAQTVSVLPKAPTTEDVKYDVFVEDQFGNLVKNEDVVVTDDLAGGLVDGDESTATVKSQLEDEAAALTLGSTTAGDQVAHAEWTTETNTWKDGDDTTAGFQPARDTGSADLEADAAAVNWYVIDFAAGAYSMTANGTEPHPVGSTVIVTYEALDQNGEPIQGLNVNFFRAGPDDEQDGDNDSAVPTNAQGKAQYVFQGIKAGTAIIDAVVRDGSTIVSEANVNHTVTFGAEKRSINAKLRGRTLQGNKDKLRVKAPRVAAGARVVLYAARGNRVVRIATGRLNSNGAWTRNVRDRNGNRKTAYAAIVRATGNSKQDTTNVRRVR